MRTKPAKIAALYWMAVAVVFVGLQAAGFDMIASGAIPVAALTAPWSVLLIAATSSVSSAPAEAMLRPFVISTGGTFFLLVVVCGGLNSALIFMLASVIEAVEAGADKHPILQLPIQRPLQVGIFEQGHF